MFSLAVTIFAMHSFETAHGKPHFTTLTNYSSRPTDHVIHWILVWWIFDGSRAARRSHVGLKLTYRLKMIIFKMNFSTSFHKNVKTPPTSKFPFYTIAAFSARLTVHHQPHCTTTEPDTPHRAITPNHTHLAAPTSSHILPHRGTCSSHHYTLHIHTRALTHTQKPNKTALPKQLHADFRA